MRGTLNTYSSVSVPASLCSCRFTVYVIFFALTFFWLLFCRFFLTSGAKMPSASSNETQPEMGYDVIVVHGFDKGFGTYSSTEFFISFSNNTSIFKGMFKKDASELGDEDVGKESSMVKRITSPSRAKPVKVRCNGDLCDSVQAQVYNDRLVFSGHDGVYTTSPPSAVLEQLGLQGGRNTVTFECPGYECEVSCHVW